MNIPRWQAYRQRHSARDIIAIDGEGITTDGVHRYVMLVVGECVTEADDLSTVQCFEALLAAPRRAIKVGFAINYDVNMWLRDLSLDCLQSLWTDGACDWRDYHLEWLPAKKFVVRSGRRQCVVWDTFGFFQTSFVSALDQWNIGSPDQRARIRRMKDARSVFTADDRRQMRSYCLDECALLTAMVRKLTDQCDNLGFPLRAYHGAGALANAILGHYHIDQYIGLPPKDVYNAALSAYFGGRFETAEIGPVGNAHSYDICSAYPAVIQGLPCLACGEWSTVNKWAGECAVYHVTWSCRGRPPRWGPLPYRRPNGAITYPANGEGWYWGAEIAALRDWWGGDHVIHGGYAYHTPCDHRPFAFVPDLYDRRRALKRTGDYGQIALKLGLNSLYGKTAQSIGHGMHKPRYQSYIWAGMITSATRAKIMRVLSDNVISIATDGLITRSPITLEIGDRLGMWEYHPVAETFIAQNGVYRYTIDGATKARSRGFSARETQFDALERVFAQDRQNGLWSTDVIRFIGLGAALARRPQLTQWRTWSPVSKTISLQPTNRLCEGDLGMDDDGPTVRTRAWLGDISISTPYRPKAQWTDVYDAPLLERLDQPDFE